MNPLDVLKEEHEKIEMELMELEAVIDDEIVNYPNLIHCFNQFCKIWNSHEEKEEKIFGVFEKERITVPVKKMTCDHKDLRTPILHIANAINSGSEFEVKKALKNDLRDLIDKVRKHKDEEDEVLYTIAAVEFTPEEWQEMSKYA